MDHISKKHRRQQAIKREKKKKIMIITVCAAVAAVIAILIAYNLYQQRNDRVYSAGEQTVRLRDNGTFVARFYHGVRRSGTYSETSANGFTSISFVYDGETADGRIDGDILTIPDEWDDNHGHGNRLMLKSGRAQ